MRASLLAALIAIAAPTDAEACSCCGAFDERTPIGWTGSGGAILLEARTNAACEYKRWLEIWVIGAKAPAGCFDLNGDPDRRIACSDVSVEQEPANLARTSKRATKFSRSPVAIDPDDVRVHRSWQSSDAVVENLKVTIEVKSNQTWKRVWQGSIAGGDPADYDRAPPWVTVWPNVRRDRALLLVEYLDPGSKNARVEVHWVELRP